MPKSASRHFDAALLFFRIYVVIAVVVILIGYVFLGPEWIWVAMLISAPVAGLVQLALTLGTRHSGFLYGGPRAKWHVHELLAGDISHIRRLGQEEDYRTALARIDAVIDQAPDFPDAWLTKAQILWNGWQAEADAKKCLQKVMKLEPDRTAARHQEAAALYREIVSHNKKGPY